MFLTVITEFVQTPSAEGFGFGASTLVAGLCLVPFSVASLLGSRLMTATLRRFGVAHRARHRRHWRSSRRASSSPSSTARSGRPA